MLTLRFEKHKACFFVAAGLPQPMRQKRGWIGVWQYGIVWRKGSRLSSTSRRCRRGERLDCKVPVPFGRRLDVALIMTLRCLPCSGLFFLETIVLLLVALTSSDWGPVILLPPGDIGPLLHRPVISGLRLRGDGDGGLAAAGDEF